MKPSEATSIDADQIHELQRLVAEGEGPHLEFKRKVAYPEKIVREMIAFANTDGGTLLVGVDDDGSMYGTRYPDEELFAVQQAIQKLCRPILLYHESVIALNKKKFVVRFDVPPGDRRPYHLIVSKEETESYVRVNDMSIKASAEMQEIVRRSKQKKDIRFTFGDHEKMLMQYLLQHHKITLPEVQKLIGLNRYKTSRKLVLLVLANVIKITATEKGDLYSAV